jgi:hypothetical protein
LLFSDFLVSFGVLMFSRSLIKNDEIYVKLQIWRE